MAIVTLSYLLPPNRHLIETTVYSDDNGMRNVSMYASIE